MCKPMSCSVSCDEQRDPDMKSRRREERSGSGATFTPHLEPVPVSFGFCTKLAILTFGFPA